MFNDKMYLFDKALRRNRWFHKEGKEIEGLICKSLFRVIYQIDLVL